MYARVANFIGSRQDLTAERLSELEDVVQDSAKAQAILEASKVSMGEVLSVGLRTSMDELLWVGMWCCCWFSVSSLWCAIFALGKHPVVCSCIRIMSRVKQLVLIVCPGASPFSSYCHVLYAKLGLLQGYSVPINSCTHAALCDVCMLILHCSIHM